MKEYKRSYPYFALCGLNCGLCPRFHTDGSSKCPGCGGPDFHLKHPSCTVITCSSKHDNVEYCFQCSDFPCKRYSEIGKVDSFISYKNVLNDLKRAKSNGIASSQIELNDKIKILEELIVKYNDGRSKSLYCQAVNLLSLSDMKSIISDIHDTVDNQNIDIKAKSKLVSDLIKSVASKRKIDLSLRK